MKIVYSPKCLEYGEPEHPESPERVKAAAEVLKKRFKFVEPEPCREKNLLLVHSRRLVESVRNLDFFKPDTPTLPKMYEYACLSAGAAIKAASLAADGENSFSLMRPPGHHAGRDSLGGFCYFNNIAIAVKWLLGQGVKKTAICDFDVHHGNGTQDIFLGERGVIYVSLHQSPFYPGTGLKSEKNCFNFPLPSGTSGKEYMGTLEKAVEIIKGFEPEVLAVSAGFDAYEGDPIGGLGLDLEAYQSIGRMIASVGVPVFSVLEGGYSSMLGNCVESYLRCMV
jgi:acetoin utilization deacetylase AcuC-like enzyme